jgi:Flp pilus assembly protein TadG
MLSKKLNLSSESGSITAMLVVLFVVLIACLAIVVDSGRQLGAEVNAQDLVNQAARDGAAQLVVGYLRQGQLVLNQTKAVQAGENFLAASGHPGTVWVVGNTVYAKLNYNIPTLFSSIFGIRYLRISAIGSAVDVSGIRPN